MFSTVIVPLDGSPHAEAAIPYAIDEARRHGADLVLIQIINRPEVCPAPVSHGGPAPTKPAWSAAEIEAETRQAERYLNDVVERYWLGSDTRRIVTVGDPTTRLLAEACTYDEPIVVMTTGDVTGGEKPPLSERARRLMVAGTVPVMCVRLPPAQCPAEVTPSALGPVEEVATPT